MRITIAQRLRPFSHTPGTLCILPGSAMAVRVFPTLVQLYNLSGPVPELIKELPLTLHGPVEGFTVQQDLEKGRVLFWGHYREGYFRYRLGRVAGKGAFALISEPGGEGDGYVPPITDRLSLGCHKAQDWDLIIRRTDLTEIFPFWLRLGQLIPPHTVEEVQGTATLLVRCREAILAADKLAIVPAFEDLFRAGFEGMLTPRLTDTDHQGLAPPLGGHPTGSPLALVYEGAQLIRSLFIQQDGDVVKVLPVLPPQFHCGRYLSIRLGAGLLDLEWSKKAIRRMVFRSEVDATLRWGFQKGIRTYRLRESNKDRGKSIPVDEPLVAQKDRCYYFDNFES